MNLVVFYKVNSIIYLKKIIKMHFYNIKLLVSIYVCSIKKYKKYLIIMLYPVKYFECW